MRASGADDGKPNRTPTAWMMTVSVSNRAPGSVLGVGHFSRVLLGHSCQAPTNYYFQLESVGQPVRAPGSCVRFKNNFFRLGVSAGAIGCPCLRRCPHAQLTHRS
jgi:hypothetical protein